MATDASGHATAVWVETRPTDKEIVASRKRSGGSWGSVRDVSALSGVGTLDQPAVAVNVADARVATWRRNTGSTLVIQSADGTEDSDTWTAPVPVSVEGTDTTRPRRTRACPSRPVPAR